MGFRTLQHRAIGERCNVRMHAAAGCAHPTCVGLNWAGKRDCREKICEAKSRRIRRRETDSR